MQPKGYFELFAVSSLLTSDYEMQKLIIIGAGQDLRAERMPILALKIARLRQTDSEPLSRAKLRNAYSKIIGIADALRAGHKEKMPLGVKKSPVMLSHQ